MLRKVMIATVIAESLIALAIIAWLAAFILVGFDVLNKDKEPLQSVKPGVYRL